MKMKLISMLNIKQTQGQKKLLQYLEDLKRNEIFMGKLNRLKTISNSKKKNNKGEEKKGNSFNEWLEKYGKYMKWLKKIKSHKTNLDKIYEQLAEEYGVDVTLLDTLQMIPLLKRGKLMSSYEDFCTIRDDQDIILNHDIFGDPPIELDKREIYHMMAYPISINIHKFASKRDVLDFIEKRWDIIENLLEIYRGEKKIRFRKRKLSREMFDFLWDNKSSDAKELTAIFNSKFKQTLAYYEVYKIIEQERKRRLKKISVGQ